jgi:uncharacterized protein involved in response to NO
MTSRSSPRCFFSRRARIYLCALVAALARILAAFEPSSALLHVAAFAWVLAFGGFAAIFGPLLLGRSSASKEQ